MDRGAKVVIIGDEADASLVGNVLVEMLSAVRKGHMPTMADFSYALGEAREEGVPDLGAVLAQAPGGLRRELGVKARTVQQKNYLDAIAKYDITVAIGPAGTGKTYLAMAAALSALLNKQVSRLILTRPAVEAGENLGFLPGDLEEKVNPYLRPLYDALHSMLDLERVQRLVDRQAIEVAPLAFMRGRTLDHAFVILDEAQNTTTEQMKMFLTRLGTGSRAVVTGDVTQIDLPKGTKSGLIEAQRILSRTKGIGMARLSSRDVVRHALVQRIVDAYEADTSGLETVPPTDVVDPGGEPAADTKTCAEGEGVR